MTGARSRRRSRLATCNARAARARKPEKAWGHDSIFAPEPKPLEFLDRGDLNLSISQTMHLMKGNIPDGYGLVEVKDAGE